MPAITESHVTDSIAEALQFVACYHPPDFIAALSRAHAAEESPAAREAIAQILVNSRMCALGQRPICQDTGVANVFVDIGVQARLDWHRPLQDIVDDAVRRAYRLDSNPLRASVVRDPFDSRQNTGDNTPAMIQTRMVAGDRVEITVSAKGGGSENKTRFAVLAPSASVADWVVEQMRGMGAGWCPPGLLGLGIGGSVDKAMAMAKEALNDPIDLDALRARGPQSAAERLRLEICDRVNALGLGAQGLGGLTSVLDVKIRHFPTHAASLPVALIPNCAATRHVRFTLDGTGPARFTPPDLALWPQITLETAAAQARRIDLDALDQSTLDSLQPGERLLLSGTLYTGRDAAHRRMVDHLDRGEALPVDLRGRALYYVGPVDPVGPEVIGPAGPTTATRMDRFTDRILRDTGLKVMIGKAERGPEALRAIAEYGAVYMVAVGGAAYLVAQAIREATQVAWPDLGMEAIYRFRVEDMPVLLAVDTQGRSIHEIGPKAWRR